MLITPQILDAIETVRAQSIVAVRLAKLPDSVTIALRQNMNKSIDLTVDDAVKADLPAPVTIPPITNGDYPTT